jgi:hypothetical protein
MDDHARTLAEDLVKNIDHFIELARNLVFWNSFASKNSIDFVTDFPPQQSL